MWVDKARIPLICKEYPHKPQKLWMPPKREIQVSWGQEWQQTLRLFTQSLLHLECYSIWKLQPIQKQFTSKCSPQHCRSSNTLSELNRDAQMKSLDENNSLHVYDGAVHTASPDRLGFHLTSSLPGRRTHSPDRSITRGCHRQAGCHGLQGLLPQSRTCWFRLTLNKQKSKTEIWKKANGEKQVSATIR